MHENKQGTGSLSIRSYTLAQTTHAHDFPQIVVPLSGVMEIAFGAEHHHVAVGHCIVIPAGTVHSYGAPEKSRFLVADMDDLPQNAMDLDDPCVAIGTDMAGFCTYADMQLTHRSDPETSDLLYQLFRRLMAQQSFAARVDPRVMRAVTAMEEDLSVAQPVEALAAVACLSVSQFKALFSRGMGEACNTYLTRRRMERARTLLTNTDYPVSVVAAEVGYDDASAFSRRFKAHFGQSPRYFARD